MSLKNKNACWRCLLSWSPGGANAALYSWRSGVAHSHEMRAQGEVAQDSEAMAVPRDSGSRPFSCLTELGLHRRRPTLTILPSPNSYPRASTMPTHADSNLTECHRIGILASRSLGTLDMSVPCPILLRPVPSNFVHASRSRNTPREDGQRRRATERRTPCSAIWTTRYASSIDITHRSDGSRQVRLDRGVAATSRA